MRTPFNSVPLKRAWFRLHWMAGLSAGLVLAVVGATGGLLGFEEPILRLLNPQLHLAADGRASLSPQQWIERARLAYPDRQPRSLAWNGLDAPVMLRMANGRERGIEVALDPYSGAVLATPRGAAFFKTVESLHRTLAAGPVGKQVVGASTALLIVLALSGVYLRWPRRPRSPAAWLRFDLQLRGRRLLRNLHAVAGTWLLAFYLVAAATGLWWSYDFYRSAVNTLAGVTTPLRRASLAAADSQALPLSIDAAWAAFRLDVPDATRASVALTGHAGAALEIRYQTAASAHERAWNTLRLDAVSGAIVGRELYAAQPRGRRFVSALFPLHSGSFFGWPGRVLMASASLLMPLFALTGICLWLLRRRKDAAGRCARAALTTPVFAREMRARATRMA